MSESTRHATHDVDLPTQIDIVALLVALAAGLCVWVDTDLWVRPVASLAFILFVPGWLVLRLAAVPFTSLMVLSSFILSLVLMVFTSFLLATRLNWIWDPVSRMWTFGCVAGLAIVLMRRFRPARVAS